MNGSFGPAIGVRKFRTRNMRAILVLMLCCLGGSIAQAIPLGRADVGFVYVWKDRAAQGMALEFLRTNGVTETTYRVVVREFTACIVKKGTEVEIVERLTAAASYEIKVLDGPKAGCVGIVQEEDIPL